MNSKKGWRGITKTVGHAPPTKKAFEVLVVPRGLLIVPDRQKTPMGGACPTSLVIHCPRFRARRNLRARLETNMTVLCTLRFEELAVQAVAEL